MKLFDLERSGNCYKIRLFLSILNIEYTKVPVDVTVGENKTMEFMALNPNGLVPVLIDRDKILYDSTAILSYLARKYADSSWFPGEIIQFTNVIRWLAFEQSEGRYGLARARAINMKNPTYFARSGTLEESQSIGIQALNTLNTQLKKTVWLAGSEKPTICDIACYPYVAMCKEGGLFLEVYPAINTWLKRIEGINGYCTLPIPLNLGT